MLNYHSSPSLSPALLAAHALLLKSAIASSRTPATLSHRLHIKSKPSSILPFLKKHARQPDDGGDDSSSCSSSVDEQNPAGKRQRRQAAATLVQNFPSWTGVGKKSKAQPRPAVLIPPKGIGPIDNAAINRYAMSSAEMCVIFPPFPSLSRSPPLFIHRNDVLCGRGGR